jgi:hypothetical protein
MLTLGIPRLFLPHNYTVPTPNVLCIGRVRCHLTMEAIGHDNVFVSDASNPKSETN